MERRISKVRFKDGKVEIRQVEDDENAEGKESSKVTHFKCSEEPAPELVEALKRLAPHVRTILMLPRDYREGAVEVISVSFSQSEGGVKGAVISGYFKLDTARSTFVFNTPHLAFEPYGDDATQPLMPAEAQADLDMLLVEAQAYWDGKRAQAGLFDGKAAAAGEGRPEQLLDEIIDTALANGDLLPTAESKIYRLRPGKNDEGSDTTIEVRT
jgi:hypothetical protein